MLIIPLMKSVIYAPPFGWSPKRKPHGAPLLGHHFQYPFHPGPASGNTLFHSEHASSHILSAALRINGNQGNASSIFPSSLSLISLRTTGNVTVNNFSNDRGFSGLYFNGDLGELILFDTPLTDSQNQRGWRLILSGKWALPLGYDPLPQPFVLSPSGELRTTRTFDHEGTGCPQGAYPHHRGIGRIGGQDLPYSGDRCGGGSRRGRGAGSL